MTNPYQQYQQNQVNMASPAELTLMLYDGIVKFTKQAKMYIDEKNVEKANNSIIRAQAILTELISTLDMNYDISKNLYSLYDYMNRRLIDANISKDKAALDEVQGLAEEFKTTWSEVVKQVRKATY